MIKVYFSKLKNGNLEITEKMLNDILSHMKRQDAEIERLNNIIDKLDRETYLGIIENQNNNDFSKGLYIAYKYINDRIKELKGADE